MKIIIASGHGRAVLGAEDARMPNLWVLPKPYALPQIQEVLLQVALAS